MTNDDDLAADLAIIALYDDGQLIPDTDHARQVVADIEAVDRLLRAMRGDV